MRTTTCHGSPWCTEHAEDGDVDGTLYVRHRSVTPVAGGKAAVSVDQLDIVDADGITPGVPEVTVLGAGDDCPLSLAETAELHGVFATVLAVLR